MKKISPLGIVLLLLLLFVPREKEEGQTQLNASPAAIPTEQKAPDNLQQRTVPAQAPEPVEYTANK